MTDDTIDHGPAQPAGDSWSGRLQALLPYVGPALAILGSIVLVVGGSLAVWGIRLIAPQYPKGLSLWFYGGKVEGPVREVNGLNHYIGMREIDLSLVPELGLWPLAVVGSVFLLLGAVSLRGRLGRLAIVGLLMVPVVVLADIQRYLIMYGSELDPRSAIRMEPFIPLVLGPSTVWNFTVWTYPGPALILTVILAVLAILARRAPWAETRIRFAAAAAGMLIGLLGTVLIVLPSVRPPEGTSPGSGVTAPPSGNVDLGRMISEAAPGSTITVPSGTYAGNFTIDRALTLIADGDVLLDGRGRGRVVAITADDVTIRGFRIAHSGGQVEEAAGIWTEEASRITIEGNTIEDFFTGIWINGGEDIRIVDNQLLGSGQVIVGADHAVSDGSESPGSQAGHDATGADPSDPHAGHGRGAGPIAQGDAISLWTPRGVLVRGNWIEEVRDGVFINYADELLIDGNEIVRSRYAVHAMFGETVTIFGNTARENLAGIVLMYTSHILAGRNLLVDAMATDTGFGVALKDVTDVRLAENRIERNRVGLQVDGAVHRYPDEAVVVRNRFSANEVGVALMATADMAFSANEFDGNLTQVLASDTGVARHNDWTNGGTGNTWGDYYGFDLDRDGIGDIPYLSAGLGPVITTTAPALAAYRTSPAMVLLEAAQRLWASDREAVVRDSAPRLQPVANLDEVVADGPVAPPVAALLTWLALGLSLLVVPPLALALIARTRTTRAAAPLGRRGPG